MSVVNCVCVGDAAQVGAARASLAGWPCHFHLLCCRYATPFLLSDSALVPSTFRLLQLPFSLPFGLPFQPTLEAALRADPAACSTLPVAATPSVWLLCVCFHCQPSEFLNIMYMQSLLQPLQLPSSVATCAHSSLLPWQHPVIPPFCTSRPQLQPLLLTFQWSADHYRRSCLLQQS